MLRQTIINTFKKCEKGGEIEAQLKMITKLWVLLQLQK